MSSIELYTVFVFLFKQNLLRLVCSIYHLKGILVNIPVTGLFAPKLKPPNPELVVVAVPAVPNPVDVPKLNPPAVINMLP